MQSGNTTLNNVVCVVTKNYRLQGIQLSRPCLRKAAETRDSRLRVRRAQARRLAGAGGRMFRRHSVNKFRFPGGHRSRVTPVPIPNTEVKPATADGTAWVTVWESRSLPGLFSGPGSHDANPAFFLYAAPTARVSSTGTAGASRRSALSPRRRASNASKSSSRFVSAFTSAAMSDCDRA